MRLTCPNCDAQYEVPDAVVPTEGRDVQCSNCGKTWYQYHPDHLPAPAQSAPAPKPAQIAPPPKEDAPVRQELDQRVQEILRAEAEREAKAREQDAGSLESQPDLGLEETEETVNTREQEARTRMARMRGEPLPDSEAALGAIAAAGASRRDLLPDIEEINSTLRSTSDRPDVTNASLVGEDEGLPVRKARGFRSGFVVVVALVAVLGLVYSFAPQIARNLPQSDPWLSSYVAQVDNLRVWLNGHATTLVNWLDAVAASSSAANDG